MDKNKNIIIGLLLAVIVIGGLFWFSKKNPSDNQGAAVNGGVSEKLSFKTAVGKQAPNFVLNDIDGSQIELEKLRGKNIVLFFNEGLMCYPACMDQVAELGKDSRFNSDNAIAFSVVVDSPDSWKKAQKELPYLKGAKILFDDGEVSKLYDVLTLPSVMHYGRYPGHTYFIIDKEGVIRYTLDDPNMALRNDQLFAELQKLQ